MKKYEKKFLFFNKKQQLYYMRFVTVNIKIKFIENILILNFFMSNFNNEIKRHKFNQRNEIKHFKSKFNEQPGKLHKAN